ncbi:Zinc finger, RING-type [Corchorus capsularis]|uniref:E3 ubiquitin-protein ligase RMA n=1 Tax=Corchorus capsularis TaxID=210143 RepID=A0A1R3GYA3_COCAP|nr:Zinc finger, RING-type [Corchorus capsularis]
MGDETSDTMNLDLNLGPAPETGSGSVASEVLNWDDLSDPFDRIREAVRRRRWRWQQVQIPAATQNLSVELDQFMGNSGNVSTLQAGEGSVTAEERTSDVPKACENTNGFLEDEVTENKDNIEKGVSNDGSFFDCNICLDLAREPVVTCCGHLFCWSCLYRWLHVHSDAKECPVCKGEVAVKTLTPIYGRGNITHEPEEDSGLKIPPRPAARRVDSWRQTIQRTALNLPVEEMIRRLGSRFDLTRDLTPPREASSGRETTDRTSSVLNRILTPRLRGEQNTVVSLDDVDLAPSTTTGTEVSSRIQSLLVQRHSQLRRAARLTSLSSALSSAERLVEAYFRSNPVGRNQEQPPPPVDDRDSFSSIAAVINSESQMDSAVEIDSVVSLSASSSRRRSDASRITDVDSGDSRAHRRRRLN